MYQDFLMFMFVPKVSSLLIICQFEMQKDYKMMLISFLPTMLKSTNQEKDCCINEEVIYQPQNCSAGISPKISMIQSKIQI